MSVIFVIVFYSVKFVEGVVEFVGQMNVGQVEFEVVGGIDDGLLGMSVI